MNKITGIIVGVILLLVVVGVVAKVFLFPSTDAATRATTKPGAMKLIELDAPILAIIPAEPTGSENAGVHYAKAIEVYLANEKVIFEAAAAISAGDLKADKDAPQSLKALEEMRGHIASGTQQAGMKFLAENSSGTLQVSKSDGNIKNLGMAIDMLDMLGDYYIKNKRTDDANAVFREMFIAGLHMIQARSHTHMVRVHARSRPTACLYDRISSSSSISSVPVTTLRHTRRRWGRATHRALIARTTNAPNPWYARYGEPRAIPSTRCVPGIP